jgi:hypothetical protein
MEFFFLQEKDIQVANDISQTMNELHPRMVFWKLDQEKRITSDTGCVLTKRAK